SGFIPASGAAGFAAKAIDQNRQRKEEGFTGPIAGKVPGLRSRLPEKQPVTPLKPAAPFAARLRELGIEEGSVKAMKSEPETLYKTRLEKISTWSNKYGSSLVSNPAFAKLTPAQQKLAIKNLQENIHEQANEREPNVELFDAASLIESA